MSDTLKFPRIIDLVTGQVGRADPSQAIPSKGIPNAFDIPFVPPMAHFLDLKPAYRKFYMRNIADNGGMTPVLHPPNGSLEGIEESGFIFVLQHVDRDGKPEFNGGMLSQMNLFRDNLVTVLRQRVRDLEIENGDLKQRINDLSTDGLSLAKTSSNMAKLFEKKDTKDRGSSGDYTPTFSSNGE